MMKLKTQFQVKAKALWVYILGPYAESLGRGLRPQSGWKMFLRQIVDIYICKWALRGFLATLSAWMVFQLFGNPYAYDSMIEGLAPKLWNTTVMVGLIFACVSVFIKMCSFFLPHTLGRPIAIRVANYCGQSSAALFKFASEIGAFGFGIVSALLFLAIICSGINVSNVVRFFGGIILLGMVFLFNLVVWWLAHAVVDRDEQPQLIKFWRQRSSVFQFLFALIGLSAFTIITLLVDGT
ncbi:MAG: hypothetical protein GY702_07075 [Desulfobulbaceae bacterium]|nr:hypothetical protein [Desulfobulbaceae bacterium]